MINLLDVLIIFIIKFRDFKKLGEDKQAMSYYIPVANTMTLYLEIR